ncbi:MAG: Gfo/Idh/MocA family protein [Hyphomicrobiales bacterium]
MEMLRVGLIGTGFMGKCHALAWASVRAVFGDVPPIRLACLAETNGELARRRADTLGFERAFGDWRALVADPAVDVVSVTTPNHLHAEMAVAALEAGKHVWCEKPMATSLEAASRMLAAAHESGKVAILGYNYVQNPAVRKMAALVADGAVGFITHVRVEMDEDFMADPNTPFSLRSDARSGYGALDDFGVHALSLLWAMVGPVKRVIAHMAMPYPTRPLAQGTDRKVETHDIATLLVEMRNGASGLIALNRAAWGRKGRIAVQIFGSRGSISFDQERMNEIRVFQASAPASDQGYATILMGPAHPPYGNFIPAPGHQLGFNDLKVIECRQLIGRIRGEKSSCIGFEEGFAIEKAVHAAAESFKKTAWVDID